ncbi:hypothetical protein H5410_003681 [Solanum commersonii]|uniref:Uncharacterized protein n=1 Tax=Solanum commersonii TaxID=4109 RepID=A0A9J6B5U3_SOLCO|nr:hypothetical protein H5410_003681 [Solanum commersonii]
MYKSKFFLLRICFAIVVKNVLLECIRDTDPFFSRREIELCPKGKDIIVESKNKKYYAILHIQHC